MMGTQLSQAIALAWDEISAAVGAVEPDFERTLTPLLRALDGDPGSSAVVAAILALFEKYPAARKRLEQALAEVAPHLAKGTGAPGLLQERYRYTVVPVFFGTSRLRTGSSEPDRFFGADRADNSFGIAEVSIPDDHRMGKLEKPRWFKLQFRADPEKHIVLLRIEPLERAKFVAAARTGVGKADKKEALVFIHGFNVSFEDAARRTAQIAYDLHFEGVPVLYSWPSEGFVAKYLIDANNATWAETHFIEFMKIVREEFGIETVHVIAHSMGTRLLVNTIAGNRLKASATAAKLRQIILAAPDIDSGTFRDLAKAFHGKAERYTLYASSRDRALAASQAIQKYPRAGLSGLDLLVVPDVDTVDATAMETDFLGHSFFGDNRSIISDIFDLVRRGLPPAERAGLSKKQWYGAPYWVFRP